jgi:hypothetical protein
LPERSIKEEAAVKKLMKKIDDIMVAITFAEAGEYEAAGETLDAEPALGVESVEPAYKSA